MEATNNSHIPFAHSCPKVSQFSPCNLTLLSILKACKLTCKRLNVKLSCLFNYSYMPLYRAPSIPLESNLKVKSREIIDTVTKIAILFSKIKVKAVQWHKWQWWILLLHLTRVLRIATFDSRWFFFSFPSYPVTKYLCQGWWFDKTLDRWADCGHVFA